MSKRARKSAGNNSLFPFLAVLICAMGAMILLLLVTTRRIRQQTAAAEAVPQSSPEVALTTLTAAPLSTTATAPHITESSESILADEPILPLFAIDTPPTRTTTTSAHVTSTPDVDPTPAWEARLAQLEQSHRMLMATIAEYQSQLDELDTARQAATRGLQQTEVESATVKAEKARLHNLYIKLREERAAAEKRRQEMLSRIAHAREQLADADSKYALIPYDGFSGTVRRPIFIECTEFGLTFASEGVTLKAVDLNGFTPRYNPLLYVTQALVRYWERQERHSADKGKPYVLLVVRPQGTVGYYIAREMLAGMKEPFGYELVTDEQEFSWPDSDPAAVSLCREIIEQMLQDRDELVSVARAQGAKLDDFSDATGRFRIEEIEQRLKPSGRTGRQVTVNGQRFNRTPIVAGNRIAGSDSRFNAESLKRNQTRQGHQERSHDSIGNTSGMSGTNGVFQEDARGARRAGENTGDNRSNDSPASGIAANGKSANDSGERFFKGESDDKEAMSDVNASIRQEAASRAVPRSREMHTFSDRRSEFDRRSITESSVNPKRPRWGERSPGGTIGFEKEIRVEIAGDEVRVSDTSVFPITTVTAIDELQRRLAVHLDHCVRTWGRAPRSFFWVPSIRFVIQDGGQPHYARLKRLTDDWGLRSSVQYRNVDSTPISSPRSALPPG